MPDELDGAFDQPDAWESDRGGKALKFRPRERRLVAVLSIALLGLAIDRFVLRDAGPHAATAAEDEGSVDAAELALALPGTASSAPALDSLTEAPDVFAWSRVGAFIAVRQPGLTDPNEAASRAAAFRESHHLQATILGPRPAAIVDERLLRIGDALDGWELREIRAREAVFSADGGEVTIVIPEPNQSP